MSHRAAPLSFGLSLALAVAGCGETAPPPQQELPPLVGALELPISFRNDARAPSGALRIEASMNELRLDGQQVYTGLSSGEIPDAEWSPEGLTQLLTRIRAAPARSVASLTFLGIVPYETVVRVLRTLETAGYRELAWAVHPPASPPSTVGWLTMSSPIVAPASGPVTFPGGARPWEQFTAHWADMYDACRAGQYIDCDGAPNEPIAGGDFQLVLWSRGQGMQMRFNRVGGPEPVTAAPAPTALIPGVPADPSSAEPPPPPPDLAGVFSFRAEEATNVETDRATGTQTPSSAISATARPVCGAAPCSVIIEADANTPIMRVLSFLGAAFPNGATAPIVAFRTPE